MGTIITGPVTVTRVDELIDVEVAKIRNKKLLTDSLGDSKSGKVSVPALEAVLEHNNFASKQGGTSGEFYHLTAAQLALIGTPASRIESNDTLNYLDFEKAGNEGDAYVNLAAGKQFIISTKAIHDASSNLLFRQSLFSTLFIGTADEPADIEATAINSIFAGTFSGTKITTGFFNAFYGSQSGTAITTGKRNVGVGRASLLVLVGGQDNVCVGENAGVNIVNNSRNICLGAASGYYETGSDKLYISSLSLANQVDLATSRTKVLIYGVNNDTTANQLLRINAILEVTQIKSGATQGASGAAVNEVWKTSGHATLADNVLMIGV